MTTFGWLLALEWSLLAGGLLAPRYPLWRRVGGVLLVVASLACGIAGLASAL